MLMFFDSFGVILKRFWSKTLQYSFQNMVFIVPSFDVELIVMELRTKSFENVQKLHQERQKLHFF